METSEKVPFRPETLCFDALLKKKHPPPISPLIPSSKYPVPEPEKDMEGGGSFFRQAFDFVWSLCLSASILPLFFFSLCSSQKKSSAADKNLQRCQRADCRRNQKKEKKQKKNRSVPSKQRAPHYLKYWVPTPKPPPISPWTPALVLAGVFGVFGLSCMFLYLCSAKKPQRQPSPRAAASPRQPPRILRRRQVSPRRKEPLSCDKKTPPSPSPITVSAPAPQPIPPPEELEPRHAFASADDTRKFLSLHTRQRVL